MDMVFFFTTYYGIIKEVVMLCDYERRIND